MGKRGRIIIVCSAVVLLAAAGIVILTPARAPEPVYVGKSYSQWLFLHERLNGASIPEESEQVDSALDQIGTNVIPTLLRWLRAYDSALKIKMLTWASQRRLHGFHFTPAETLHLRARYGFAYLGPRASNAVPELIKILNLNVSPDSVINTMVALEMIGPGAKTAVPSILQVTTSTNEELRRYAIWILGEIHAQPELVVPVLIKARHDPSPQIRARAAYALGQFGSEAKPAVPTLVEWLADTNENIPNIDLSGKTVHFQVKYALQQIDPETYARVATNEAVPNP